MVTVADKTKTPETQSEPAETVSGRIAAVLGDAAGSYELLISARICAALGVDPTFRGHLVEQT